METSTVKDIQDNIEELTRVARILITTPSTEEDWWHNYTIGNKDYDLNVFDWELPTGEPVRIVAVHPVLHDGSGYGELDASNYIRLITEPRKVEA